MSIKDHIQKGDIYEMNYCIEFFADSGSGNLSLVNLTFYGYRLRQNTSGGHSTNAYGSD